ncbi:MAG: UDP-2,3-diacylglucosamine diphosphatase [Gemmatimonadales bacterium]|nr:MAG: UDP-2,3-diacylglucosamine diphosphatase [Gemmatimonadales bacterium]
MSQVTSFVTSDVHLGAIPPDTVRTFHQWLRWTAERADLLVINGDLFDFWFEYRSVIPRGYTRTLGILGELVDQGVAVHLVGGNHDWWGGSMLTDEIGVHFHHEPVVLEVSGRRCLFAHGDGLGRGDLGYRAMRWTLRSRPTRWLFRWLHPDVGAAVARKVSRTKLRQGPQRRVGRDHEPPANPSPASDPAGRSDELRRWARNQLLDDPTLHDVFLGHTHLPIREEVAPGRFYVNSGDWLNHNSFVAVTGPDQAPELFHWTGDAKPRPLTSRGF